MKLDAGVITPFSRPAATVNGQTLAYGTDFLASVIPGTASNAPLVFAGDGWFVKTANREPLKGLDVRGKVVVAYSEGGPRGMSFQQLQASGRQGVDWADPTAYARDNGAVGIIYLNVIYSHAVVAIDAQRKMIIVYLLTALATLGGYLLFIPTYGMFAAAWLTVFSEVCVGIGSFFVTRRYTKTDWRWRPGLAALGASIVMAAVIWPLRDHWLPIPVFSGIVIYILGVWALGGVSKTTIQNLLSLKREPPTPPIGA